MSLPRPINRAPYNVTQRNAIASWMAQDVNKPHIVLLGDEGGVSPPASPARARNATQRNAHAQSKCTLCTIRSHRHRTLTQICAILRTRAHAHTIPKCVNTH
jgi:hypothetical protein